MIGWLRGRVVRRNPAAGIVVLDSGGIGWELHVSIQTLAGIPEEGLEAELWVHTNVREDAIQLFGFADEHEKQLFRMLTSVPKVGPRNAVAVLGGFPVLELAECIAGGESAKLVKIPGIGKKTAEQIVLTLSDKILKLLEPLRIARGVEGAGEAVQTELPAGPTHMELQDAAREVLTSLGWKSKAVDRALERVLKELGEDAQEEGLDSIVRAALAQLMER